MAQVYAGRWEVIRSLSEGGQAAVFLVKDQSAPDGEIYVLKRLKNVERVERFRAEAQALQALQHPNIAQLIDTKLDDSPPKDQRYIVMRYYPGGNLGTLAGRLRDSHSLAFELFLQICDALSRAHAKRIYHRDIKPENILLEGPEGPAVLTDFGICYIEGEERRTLTYEAVGSWFCIAPELDVGRVEVMDPRADVYCLGRLLYWMLSGGREFYREDFRASGRNLVELIGDPRLEAVNLLLDRMVTEDPNDRFADAEVVAIETRKALSVLQGKYNVVSSKVPQGCLYCGRGTYELRYQPKQRVIDMGGGATRTEPVFTTADEQFFRSIGINNPYSPPMRVLVCNYCGHVQMFSTIGDEAQRRWENQ